MGKEAAPDNEVEGAVQLEKEWLAGLKSLECFGSATRLPEIDFVDGGDVRNDVEPVVVGDANVES